MPHRPQAHDRAAEGHPTAAARRAVAAVLARHLNRPPAEMAWAQVAASSRSRCYRVSVPRSSNPPARFFVKAIASGAPSQTPGGSTERELAAYELLAGDPALPALIGSCRTDGDAWHWIALELVEGSSLDAAADDGAWTMAGTALAAIHARAAALEPTGVPARVLPVLGAAAAKRFANAADAVLRGLEPAGHRPAGTLLRKCGEAWDELASSSYTLVHGECFATHVLVEREPPRVRIVDWEDACWGPAALDLDALLWGVSPERREAVLEAYKEARRTDPRFRQAEVAPRRLAAAAIVNRVTYVATWADRLTTSGLASLAAEIDLLIRDNPEP